MSFANLKRLSGKSFWPQLEMNTSLILVPGTILTQGSTFKTQFPTPDILRTQIPHLEFAITGPTTLDKTSNGQTMTAIFSIPRLVQGSRPKIHVLVLWYVTWQYLFCFIFLFFLSFPSLELSKYLFFPQIINFKKY